MSAYNNFRWFCFVLTIVTASAVPLADNNVLAEFLLKTKETTPIKGSVVFKRRIFEDNSDLKLKQISLRSLIGDVEKDLFVSALNANKELADKNTSVTDKENSNTENQPLLKEENDSDIISTTSEITTILPETVTEKLASPTTEKLPQSSGVPTHIVIDRIAIQPHHGGITFIPIFELKPTTKDEDKNKDHEITKITISKTEITSLATSTPTESSTSASSTLSNTTTNLTIEVTTPSTSSTHSNTSTIEVTSETVTTPKNIEQLKEAEEELKEKVAEIEAEPIILSARV